MSRPEEAGGAHVEGADERQGEGKPEDAGPGAYRVVLPEFEGPLDLLLYLCKTHEIEIVKIPIAFITQKYLEYLEMMEAVSVEVAAEYLVMAATLAYLKSRELVPSPEPLETSAEGEAEGEEATLDPREELIRRLLEYQKYKDAAEQLGARPIEGRNVFGRGAPAENTGVPGPLAEHSPWKLIEAFAKLLDKEGPRTTHDVVIDRMSIGERINQIVDRIEASGGSFRFDTVIDFTLPDAELRHQLVVTLLAILELAKLKAIRVMQDPESEVFFITRADGVSLDEARRVLVTSDEDGAAPPPASAPQGEADE